jgi:uncharacterized protein YkwD
MSRRFAFGRSRSLALETLESREVLSSGGPSAEAQYMLELINMARTNPQAAAQWVLNHDDADVQTTLAYYGVDLNAAVAQIASANPVPPVGWSDTLAATATQQSQDQVNMGVQTHSGANGSTLGQRLDQAGLTDRTADGEIAYAYSKSVDHAMEAFLVDWGVPDLGHRRNILQPGATPDQYFRDAGVGIVQSNRPNFGPKVITVDFTRQAGSKPELLGVAYFDQNGNGAYDLGEGAGNVEVDATNLATGQTSSATTYDNGGGYQIPLDPGAYQVTARVGNQVVRSQQVSIGDQNVEVDYNLSQPWQGPQAAASVQSASSAPVSARMMTAPAPTVALQTQSAPAPAPTPAPAGPTSGGDWTTWNGGWTAWHAGQQ